MATSILQIGPLASTIEVSAFLLLTGATWFNGVELLFTIFFSFQRWTSTYFYCLVIATIGVLVYQLNVFLMIFTANLNMHTIIAFLLIGWSFMVTGQSLVLWSRLHLVCHSAWKLKAILYLIIANAVCLHIPQTVFSLIAVKNGAIDPTYRPFEIMERISISVFTFQELLISIVYLKETLRILHTGELIHKATTRRRIQLLFLANIALIAIDTTTVTLEFLALWGIWCSFKGFGYSTKLKIEFAILKQLRDSVKNVPTAKKYEHPENSGIVLDSRGRGKKSRSGLKRDTFHQLEDQDTILKTTEIFLGHSETQGTAREGDRKEKNAKSYIRDLTSGSSSEIELAVENV